MPVFPAIFEHVAGNLLSVDGSATQLPAILLAILLGVDAPLDKVTGCLRVYMYNQTPNIFQKNLLLCHFRLGTEIPVVGCNEVSVSIHQTVKLELKQKDNITSLKMIKP